MMVRWRLGVLLLGMALAGASARAERAPEDLRGFRVGMPVEALPIQGYTDLTCAGGESKGIASWAEFRTCAAGENGLREVSFRYDDDPEHKTRVAGQPMLLSLVFDTAGSVQAIRMQTDPSARLYQRKRGYMFGEQVMARYGDYDWACTDGKPSATEAPVGGVFIRQHCERTIGMRHLVVDRALYRGEDPKPAAFTSTTTFTVSLVKPDAG